MGYKYEVMGRDFKGESINLAMMVLFAFCISIAVIYIVWKLLFSYDGASTLIELVAIVFILQFTVAFIKFMVKVWFMDIIIDILLEDLRDLSKTAK